MSSLTVLAYGSDSRIVIAPSAYDSIPLSPLGLFKQTSISFSCGRWLDIARPGRCFRGELYIAPENFARLDSYVELSVSDQSVKFVKFLTLRNRFAFNVYCPIISIMEH